MNNTIQYKGYCGSVEFSEEDGIFFVPDDFFENEARFGNPPSPKSLSGKQKRYENAVKNRTQTLYTL